MKILRVICVVALVACVAACALAAEGRRTAKIISIDGKAEVRMAGQVNWLPASVDMVLSEGDVLKTLSNSFALLNVDGIGQTATVEVKENSQLLLSELMVNPENGTHKTLLDLAAGEILIKAQKVKGEESKFEVKTPTSIVGVRGTTFAVKVEAVEE
jgi:hypothetical protein